MKNAFNGTMNDEDCFNHELSLGIDLDNDSYVNLFNQTAKEIVSITGAKTFLDCGGGMGAYTKAMLEQGLNCTYVDLSKLHGEYVTKRLVKQDVQTLHIYIKDFTTQKWKTFDLVASIEVMEHIEDEKLIPFLTNLKCKYFHFSSTPNKTDFDEKWGHINIKSEEEWIALFEQCGYKLDRKMSLPTTWSLLFTK
jgi:2-polyprenyl-3-methyl-5-hydroxy-6-metoxy-1,4-benzoquinol methylase